VIRHHPPPLPATFPAAAAASTKPFPFFFLSLEFFFPTFFSSFRFYVSFIMHGQVLLACLLFCFISLPAQSLAPNRQITLYSFLLEPLFVCIMLYLHRDT